MEIRNLVADKCLGRSGGEEEREKEFTSNYTMYSFSLNVFCPLSEAENCESLTFLWCLGDLETRKSQK